MLGKLEGSQPRKGVICAVGGCDNPRQGQGYCNKHYQRRTIDGRWYRPVDVGSQRWRDGCCHGSGARKIAPCALKFQVFTFLEGTVDGTKVIAILVWSDIINR
jgi:hypothetical protein